MARPRKTAAAAAQTKNAAVKTAPVKAEAAPAAETKTVETKTEEIKAEAPKAPEKKAQAEKEEKKAAPVEKTVVVEFSGRQIKAKEVLAQAEAAFAAARPGVEIQNMELYIIPEKSEAYYVVNGEASSDFRIEL